VFLGVQSMYAPDMGLTDLCYDLALLSHYFLKPAEKPEKVPVLVLGFATGTFAKLCRKYFPDSQIDGVEIDPGIVEAGRKYFALTDDDARVFVDDGRAFLTKTDKKYRIIFLDAFQDVTYPFHMSTREFFQQLMRNLSDDGVLVINVNMRSQIKPDLVSYLTGTLQGLFPKVMLCTHPDYYNRVFFVSRDGQIFDNFKANFDALPIDHPLFKLTQRAFPGLKDAEKSDLVLTDDLAPVELIGFKVLNEQLRTAFREVLVRTILQLKDAI
ncbi:MAG TPA: fused MFS/spermidine synthase, partial [Candidatus Rifleibacterium sp.]|nr:fused MFS/spermidine synthase [Candidatus Rifleibacterium sp.]